MSTLTVNPAKLAPSAGCAHSSNSGASIAERSGDDAAAGGEVKWLVAEYCGHDIFMGWHLYLRDDPGYKRNKDGDWGWLRGPVWERDRKGNRIVEFFATLGIDLKGDWSCGHYGLAEFVKRFPLGGRKVWKEPRGGVRVIEGYWGDLTLAPLGGGGAEHEEPRQWAQRGRDQGSGLNVKRRTMNNSPEPFERSSPESLHSLVG